MTSRIRRASILIAENIAEGLKKKSKKDKDGLYNISQGLIEECEHCLITIS
ncbi:MAG: four helix bundle protein [Melioribacteraceae bacterium]|nr:four helix bundle protein [Melioribacteraceae bacterium]